jgi:hypothetical protein
VEKPERKRPLEDLGVDDRIILEQPLKKSVRWAWTGLMWLRMGRRGVLL